MFSVKGYVGLTDPSITLAQINADLIISVLVVGPPSNNPDITKWACNISMSPPLGYAKFFDTEAEATAEAHTWIERIDDAP
jgi:hypothetical protein